MLKVSSISELKRPTAPKILNSLNTMMQRAANKHELFRSFTDLQYVNLSIGLQLLFSSLFIVGKYSCTSARGTCIFHIKLRGKLECHTRMLFSFPFSAYLTGMEAFAVNMHVKHTGFWRFRIILVFNDNLLIPV